MDVRYVAISLTIAVVFFFYSHCTTNIQRLSKIQNKLENIEDFQISIALVLFIRKVSSFLKNRFLFFVPS